MFLQTDYPIYRVQLAGVGVKRDDPEFNLSRPSIHKGGYMMGWPTQPNLIVCKSRSGVFENYLFSEIIRGRLHNAMTVQYALFVGKEPDGRQMRCELGCPRRCGDQL